jgi:ferredoxin
MIHRRGMGSGRKNRRRMGEGATRGRGGGRGRGQAMGEGRHGKLGMRQGPGSGSSARAFSFQESGAINRENGDFRSDAETLIQKLRFIKKRILEIENADMAPAAPKETPVRLPGAGKRIPKITAVVDKEKCICCGICIDICPEHAISVKGEVVMGEIMIDSSKCNACGTCVSACPNEALSLPRLAKTAI